MGWGPGLGVTFSRGSCLVRCCVCGCGHEYDVEWRCQTLRSRFTRPYSDAYKRRLRRGVPFFRPCLTAYSVTQLRDAVMILRCKRPISQFKAGDLIEVEGNDRAFDHNDFELVPDGTDVSTPVLLPELTPEGE